MSLKTRFITLTALGLLVLVAFSGVLPAAHAQSSPSVAVSLSDASVEQGTAITATMSFRGLTFDSDASTTDYTFRADVTGANDCEGGGLGRTRYMYRVDQDPEVRSGTISASCPAGDYTIRATISTPQSVALAAATVSFTVAAPAQEPTASPTASIVLSPSDAVGEGAEITATMSFGGLASDSDASTTDYVFRADVVDADDCEGGGIGFDRYMYRVDQDPETRTGTISADCPAGAYTLRVSISSSDNTELASASASFFILGAPVLIEPPTLTALSVSHGDPAVDVTLAPAFESGTLAYRAAVRVAQVTIAPTASDPDATVAYLDGNDDAIADADAGADGHQVGLGAGSNTVKVAVSKDGLTTTYTVKLFRLVTQQQNSDTTFVSNTGQTTAGGAPLPIGSDSDTPGAIRAQLFTTGSNTGGYNLASVGVDIHTVPTDASGLVVTLRTEDSGNPSDTNPITLTTPATLTTGVNTFAAPANTVLAASTGYFVHMAYTGAPNHTAPQVAYTTSDSEDSGAATGWNIGDMSHYRQTSWVTIGVSLQIQVTGSAVSGTQPPQSSDATLSELTLVNAADDAAITLTPTFVSATEGYRASVVSAVAQVTVAATTNHASATFEITPTDADSGTAGHQVNMGTPGGDTRITVAVTAEDGSDKTYTVTVSRAAAPGGLTSLSVSPGTLSPPFDREQRSYRVEVGNAVTQVTITTEGPAGVQVQFTKVNVVLADADAVAEGHQVDLAVGDNVISVIAVGPGSVIETYVVTVARAAAVGVSVVTLNLDATTIDEDSGTAVNVTATLSAAKTTEFTVTVTAAVSPATDAAYTLSANTTLTFAASATESTGTVTITPVNNNDNERDKVITVSGAVAAGVTGVTAPADVTLTIEDDDHPVVNHTITLHRNNAAKTLLDPTMIPENVGQVCVRVTATTESDLPPETDDRPTGSSRSDTAVSPGDFSAVSGQFYLPRSAYSLQSGKYVAVRDECTALRIVDDSVDEGNEQFALYTQQSPLTPQTYEFEFTPSNPLTVTIIDNDEASLSIADAGGAEGEDLEFTVTLDPTSVREVTVDWAVDDGTATAGDDYTDGSGTLTFAPGHTTKTITVATLPDTAAEGAETFTVTLSNASNAAIGDAEATGTIAASEDVTVSTDATLKRLRLSHTNISDFQSGTTSYSVSLADSVVTVTPTANHPLAAIMVNGAQVASGSDLEVDLVLGANTVTIEVTAQDGIATKTYTVTVTRHECPGQEVAGEFVTDATGCPRLTLLDTGKVRVEWDAVTSGTTVTVRYYLNFVVTKVNPDGTKQKGKWFTKSDHYSGVTDSHASLTGETFSNLPLEANVVYFSYQTDGSAWSPWSMIWIDPQ